LKVERKVVKKATEMAGMKVELKGSQMVEEMVNKKVAWLVD
jgi:hypothetical protein